MEYFAGIDVSLELSSVCVVDAQGKIRVFPRSETKRVGELIKKAHGDPSYVAVPDLTNLLPSALSSVAAGTKAILCGSRLCGRRA